MHFLLETAAVIGAVTLILATARRWIVRPVREASHELHRLVEQIRAAQTVSLELHQLAGAIANLGAALMSSRFEDRQRLDETVEIVIDLSADVARIAREVAELQMSA